MNQKCPQLNSILLTDQYTGVGGRPDPPLFEAYERGCFSSSKALNSSFFAFFALPLVDFFDETASLVLDSLRFYGGIQLMRYTFFPFEGVPFFEFSFSSVP